MSKLKFMILTAAITIIPMSAAFAQWNSMQGMLLFTSDRDGDEEIFKAIVTSAADVQQETQLTFNADKDNRARFSPDGTSIAFIRNDSEVWMMDNQGGNQHFVTKGETVDFSPDGTKLAISVYGGIISVYNLQTQALVNIVGSSIYVGHNYSPDWSPDGQKIIYRNKFLYMWPHYTNIMIVNPDGSGVKNLTGYNEYKDIGAENPRWSPDGTKIAYECGQKICTMNPDGSNQVYPYSLKIGGTFSWPVWSPDGNWHMFNLAGSSTPSFNGKLFLIKLDITKASAFVAAENHPGNNYPTDWFYLGDVTAPPAIPPSVTLTALPTTINYPKTTTLNWSSMNASSCIGSISGGWSGVIPLSGNAVLQPTATATYTVSCTGNGGTDSKSVTVNVNLNEDCLFNWAENNYANLFSPVGAMTQSASPYLFRYYQNTNSYVGVSLLNNHVYYLGPEGGSPQDVGDLSGWLTLAQCQ